MKTLLRLLSVSLLLALAAILVNCGGSNGGGSNSPAPVSTIVPGYYMQNGYCYNSANQPVGTTCPMTSGASNGYYMQNGYCYSNTGQIVGTTCPTTTGTNGYYLLNGLCYSPTGQMVATTFCSTTTVGGTSCQGLYYYPVYYSFEPVYCSGANCRGYTLYNQSGMPVVCQ